MASWHNSRELISTPKFCPSILSTAFWSLNTEYCLSCSLGETGEKGIPGPEGPLGPQGQRGPQGPRLAGVSYNLWGRTNCSGDATVVYTGKDIAGEMMIQYEPGLAISSTFTRMQSETPNQLIV